MLAEVNGNASNVGNHSQSTQRQDNSDPDLAASPQLQTTQQWHRSNNSRDIGKDPQRRLREIERWPVHAHACRDIFENPAGTDWVAAEDVCKDSCDRIAHYKGEEGPDGYGNVAAEEDAEVE